ncbi:SCO family protein [Halomonas vilamensis]|uniref:SCO family protein n=1 Tax=Vreelandella vilamensis TaxID=531309 RepID=A0ABU1H4P6_9GAMM|nr:SCO family protein [Halomonas vilamensis]MDR5899280.1 SCO family protein [Halomonas vilamensis]
MANSRFGANKTPPKNDVSNNRASKSAPLWLGSALFLLLVFVGALGLYRYMVAPDQSGEPIGGPIELPSTQGDFSLTQLGEDQFAVVSFGYTYCPDVCPMNQAVKKQALAQLTPEQRERVVPLMISVDPERDSIERLREYTGFFGEQFIGATGSQAQLEELAERYGVIWRRVEAKDSAMEYTIDHSASLYVVNREGDIVQRVLYSPTADALTNTLKTHLDG